ncbi:hypothetical protein A260_23885, partial [Pseudomonas syringae pv. actinidiae ICMP 19068]
MGSGTPASTGNALGEARQVIAASEFRELPLYAALDCVVHLIAICVPASVTFVIRSPWLIDTPGRRPG